MKIKNNIDSPKNCNIEELINYINKDASDDVYLLFFIEIDSQIIQIILE